MSGSNAYDSWSLIASLALTILYFIVYLATIAMGKVDVLIATKLGETRSDWADVALSEDNFRYIHTLSSCEGAPCPHALPSSVRSADLNNWKNLASARFACAALAWIG